MRKCDELHFISLILTVATTFYSLGHLVSLSVQVAIMASNNIVIVNVSIETFHRHPGNKSFFQVRVAMLSQVVYAGVKANVLGLLFKYSDLESDKINPFKNNKGNTLGLKS